MKPTPGSALSDAPTPIMTEDWQLGGFGLYVHWPFCLAKCPYCDFNSHVGGTQDEKAWLKAFLSEIRRHASMTGRRKLDSIFFGGGTPSLMSPELVGGIIEAAVSAWPASDAIEITLEANPTSVEATRLSGYKHAGVNRLSMGVQALNDPDLRKLGRTHSANEARSAFSLARRVFDSVSFDLIYARQHQTLAEWESELREAVSMSVDHLSLYQLTIEDGTPFAARRAAGGLKGLPIDDDAADMYDATQEICETAGLPAYEVSNHARPGAESRHNLIYWQSGDWAGVGPGAHGRLTLGAARFATEAIADPRTWLRQVEGQGSGELCRVGLSLVERGEEYLMMALRLRQGADIARFENLSGRRLDPSRIESLEADGLVSTDGRHIHASTAGRLVLNGVLRTLLG